MAFIRIIMTGQETILKLMKENPEGLKPTYEKMLNIYVDEFGKNWVCKEIELANKEMKEKNFNLPEMFNWMEKKMANAYGYFVGTTEISRDKYVLYSKGLYFLAEYQLTIKERL